MLRSLKMVLILLVVGAIAAGGWFVLAPKLAGQNTKQTEPIYTVARGRLAIHVTESGTVKSRDQRIVRSRIEGRTTIISLVDEGVRVKEGDLLIELDASKLENDQLDRQGRVQNAEAEFVRAREQLEVIKSQNESNIADAELRKRFATEDLEKYTEGEWPNQLKEAQTKVTLADEDLKRASDDFDWSKRLYDEKYISESQYKGDELQRKRAELQADLAREQLALLEQYTHTRKLTELQAEITQKGMALDRVRLEAGADLIQAEASLKARQAEFEQQQDKLAKIVDQISKTKIYAPADGMVVYATSAQFSWRGDTQPLAEGSEVREREQLIHLPTADSMMVEINVHESALSKVAVGQSVRVKIDAMPDIPFTGKVTKIAPLPDATSAFMNPDLKVFPTQILLDGIHPDLRTGMSCEATILVEEHADTVFVPIQTVVGQGGKPVVYLMNTGQPEPREVKVGLDNNIMIHILDGLADGDQIWMTPPLGEMPTADTPEHQAAPSPPRNPGQSGKRRPGGGGP